MKFYRDPQTDAVFAYEADGSQDDAIRDGLVLMTAAEIERHLSPPPTQEQVEAAERAWRDAAVVDVTWLRERHRDERELGRDTTLSADQFGELLSYLQSLRDWPQSEQFPEPDHRPTAPGWIGISMP
ncbi:phage tail assembly chaperone [Pseudomonas putida]|uniref:Phage tail protein n=1 Tax=Pseudomonas putida TaxID=303 RepID=A0A177SRE1_PSEPU|nr:phage tail assembly chaperone [Pseudomonas putida]OAI93523.1 hypothetical protein AYO28_14115 [Pseudomonas putida]